MRAYKWVMHVLLPSWRSPWAQHCISQPYVYLSQAGCHRHELVVTGLARRHWLPVPQSGALQRALQPCLAFWVSLGSLAHPLQAVPCMLRHLVAREAKSSWH